MPFQPGNKLSVGVGGLGSAKRFQEALDRALKQYKTKDISAGQALRAIADKLVEVALTGEQWAIKEVIDRIDGKAHQAVSVEVKNIREYTRSELADYLKSEIIDAEEVGEFSDETASPGAVPAPTVGNGGATELHSGT